MAIRQNKNNVRNKAGRRSGRPLRVAIVALDDGLLSTVTVPLEIFRLAGVAPEDVNAGVASPFFDVRVFAARGGLRGFGGVSMQGNAIVAEPCPDLVFVSSAGLRTDDATKAHAAISKQLRRWYEAGATIAAVCTGVIVLAESGLLDGRSATTHWAIAPWFRQRYPRVRLREGEMYTHDGRVWCGAGGHAAQDLALRLVAHLVGAKAAQAAARILLLDAPRSQQAPYMAEPMPRHHDDPMVARVQRRLALNPAHAHSIDELARDCCLSPRSLMRRFRQGAGTTVREYHQTLRIEEAKRLLADSARAVGVIGADVGYEDASYFRALFKRKVGISPVDYRRRIRHGAEDDAESPT